MVVTALFTNGAAVIVADGADITAAALHRARRASSNELSLVDAMLLVCEQSKKEQNVATDSRLPPPKYPNAGLRAMRYCCAVRRAATR